MTEHPQESRLQGIQEAFTHFVKTFGIDTTTEVAKYDFMLQQLAEDVTSSNVVFLQVEVDDMRLSTYLETITEDIISNIPFYVPILSKAASAILLEKGFDGINVLVHLIRSDVHISIKDLSAELCGRFVSISGTVVRTSDVKPELVQGVFRCLQCQGVSQPILQTFGLVQPSKCLQCKQTELFELIPEKSVFANYQKLKLQDEVAGAGIAIDVISRGPISGSLKPGDPVTLSGFAFAQPESQEIQRVARIAKEVQAGFAVSNVGGGLRFGQRLQQGQVETQTGLLSGPTSLPKEYRFKLQFFALAFKFQKDSKDVSIDASKALKSAQDPEVVNKLIQSFAPHIHGNEQIKLALLLQSVGGTEKETAEKLRIRSDLNVLLVGDPSCAKSLFLKSAMQLSDRAVYTSGKSASVAGLTAAIVQDENGDWGVEAGVMLRASGGIACVDEFEKISISDQSALHECMEQQSVSLSKAGVQATMKARTSVLAAMNPVGGRYDQMRTLRQNINIGQAILSRFDIVFVLIDKPNEEIDQLIARKIISVHMLEKTQKLQTFFSEQELRNYLTVAREHSPRLMPDAEASLIRNWQELREQELIVSGSKNYRITVRQLESLIRLSEAFAKLELQQFVTEAHVAKARTLLETTLLTMEKEKYIVDLRQEPISADQPGEADDIEHVVPSESQAQQASVTSAELRRIAILMRYSVAQMGEESDTYEYFCNFVAQNVRLSDDVYLSEDEKCVLGKQIINMFVSEMYWLARVDDGEADNLSDTVSLKFTDLAPPL